jgi:hypothetical protein
VIRFAAFGAILVAVCAAGGCGATPQSMDTTTTPSPTTPTGPIADLSGMWSGTFQSANFSTQPITLTVVQTTNCVDGAWVSSSGDWKGAISGFATADAFSGFISLERSANGGGACAATASVSGPASQNTLQMTATAFTAVGSCTGDLPTNGVVNLHR